MKPGYAIRVKTHLGTPDGETRSTYFTPTTREEINNQVLREAIEQHVSEQVSGYLHREYGDRVRQALTEQVTESLSQRLSIEYQVHADGLKGCEALEQTGLSFQFRLEPAISWDGKLYQLTPLPRK